MNENTPSTKRVLKRIAPLSLGKMLAVLYGVLGLLLAPVFLLASLVGSSVQHQGGMPFMALGAGMTVAIPFFYAAIGFVFGVVSAFLYNLLARWIGGVEFEVA